MALSGVGKCLVGTAMSVQMSVVEPARNSPMGPQVSFVPFGCDELLFMGCRSWSLFYDVYMHYGIQWMPAYLYNFNVLVFATGLCSVPDGVCI